MENFFRRMLIPIWVFNLVAWTWLLGGCDKLHMERVAEVKTTQITWIKETPQSCGNVPGHINACATSASDWSWCVIRAPESTPDSTLAEEFRHCFGEVHPK